jgi:hypothetical protein
MQADFLAEFSKSGRVVTDLNGISNVVFLKQIPNDTLYSVLLTVINAGIGYSAYVTNVTQTGFTINTWVVGGAGSVAPTISVYWLVVPNFNS